MVYEKQDIENTRFSNFSISIQLLCQGLMNRGSLFIMDFQSSYIFHYIIWVLYGRNFWQQNDGLLKIVLNLNKNPFSLLIFSELSKCDKLIYSDILYAIRNTTQLQTKRLSISHLQITGRWIYYFEFFLGFMFLLVFTVLLSIML